MNQQQPRKIRSDLTPAERERLERYGSFDFKSIRRVDMRVLPFIADKDHR
jgi:hypothetical protein